ncbi:MAG: hypothetical protein ACREIB_05495 [Pseudomonadota bacterium]
MADIVVVMRELGSNGERHNYRYENCELHLSGDWLMVGGPRDPKTPATVPVRAVFPAHAILTAYFVEPGNV